jgi:hypothetical protein
VSEVLVALFDGDRVERHVRGTGGFLWCPSPKDAGGPQPRF